jgi:Fe2+ transport system protein B
MMVTESNTQSESMMFEKEVFISEGKKPTPDDIRSFVVSTEKNHMDDTEQKKNGTSSRKSIWERSTTTKKKKEKIRESQKPFILNTLILCIGILHCLQFIVYHFIFLIFLFYFLKKLFQKVIHIFFEKNIVMNANVYDNRSRKNFLTKNFSEKIFRSRGRHYSR